MSGRIVAMLAPLVLLRGTAIDILLFNNVVSRLAITLVRGFIIARNETGVNFSEFVLVMKRLNTVSYISQSRLANSLGDKPGQGNP